MSFSGYVLNGEQDNFFYMSLSRLHPQRIRTATGVSGNDSVPAGAPVQEATQEKETQSQPATAESEVINRAVRAVGSAWFVLLVCLITTRV